MFWRFRVVRVAKAVQADAQLPEPQRTFTARALAQAQIVKVAVYVRHGQADRAHPLQPISHRAPTRVHRHWWTRRAVAASHFVPSVSAADA